MSSAIFGHGLESHDQLVQICYSVSIPYTRDKNDRIYDATP